MKVRPFNVFCYSCKGDNPLTLYGMQRQKDRYFQISRSVAQRDRVSRHVQMEMNTHHARSYDFV